MSSIVIGPDFANARTETFAAQAPEPSKLGPDLAVAVSQLAALAATKRAEYLTVVQELASNKQVAPERINIAVRSMGRTLHQLEKDIGTAKNRITAAKKLDKANGLRSEWQAACETGTKLEAENSDRIDKLQAEIDTLRQQTKDSIQIRDSLHMRANSLTLEATNILNPTTDPAKFGDFQAVRADPVGSMKLSD